MTRASTIAAMLRAQGVPCAVKQGSVLVKWGGVDLFVRDSGDRRLVMVAPELLKADLTRAAVRLRIQNLPLADLAASALDAIAQAEPGHEELTRREILAVIAERKRRAVDSAAYQLARKEEALSAAQRELYEAQAVHAQALTLDAAVLAALGMPQ